MVCVRLAPWSLQHLAWKHPESVSRPVVIHASGRRGSLVVVGSRQAIAAGVVPGLPLAEARALLEGGPLRPAESPLFVEEDLRADREALRTLAAWCRQFTPHVGLEEGDRPECLLLDVTGCASLFGDEPTLLARLGTGLRDLGLHPRLAVADTLGAAWGLARCTPHDVSVPPGGTAAALAPLPIEALRLAPAAVRILRELHVETLERLLRLPRLDWATRFGPDVARRIDQALGRLPEPLRVEPDRAPPAATEAFEWPTTDALLVQRRLRRLLEQLVREVADRGEGLLRLDVALRHDPAPRTTFALDLLQPCVSVAHLDELLRLRLERIRLAGEIVGLELRAAQTAPRRTAPQELFPDERRSAERDLSALCERLAGRLGRAAVLRPVLTEEPEPESAGRFEPWVGGEREPGTTNPGRTRPAREAGADCEPRSAPAPERDAEAERRTRCARSELRPLCLLPEPCAVRVTGTTPDGAPRQVTWSEGRHAVVRAWGPERIVSGWWRPAPVARDYWRVELETGQWLWLFVRREEGTWWCHGTFD